MIGRRRRSPEAGTDAPSPWATGDVEVLDRSTEIEWDEIERRRDPDDGDLDAPTPPRSRGNVIGAIAAAVAVVLVGAVVLWPGGEGDDADDPDAADAPPPSLDTLPASEDELVTTTLDEELDDDDPADGAGDASSGDGGTALLDPIVADDTRPTSIELPPALTRVARPTEIVMATADGVATLSLPSGSVRYATDTDPIAGGGNLVVAPDAAALSGGRNTVVIVPRVGLPIEFQIDADQGAFIRGWSTDADGDTVFQIQSFGPDGESTSTIDVDGVVTPDDSAYSTSGFSTYDYARTGDINIVNDAGGVYLIAADGSAQRIATGRAFAANGDFILLRECDEALRCSLVVENHVTDERREVDPELEIANVFGLDLAPDGTAVISIGDPGAEDTVRVIDLVTGTQTPAGPIGPTFFSPGTTWLADSSGFLQSAFEGIGLTHYDRASGERTTFGAELGRISAMGVRYPGEELTVAPADLIETPVEIDALSGPTGLRVVVLGTAGTMALLDVDRSTAVAWRGPEVGGPRDVQLFQAGDAVTVLGANEGYVARPGEVREIDVEVFEVPEAPRFPGPQPSTVWAPDPRASTTDVDFRQQSIDPLLPATEGARVTVDGVRLLGGDGRGGLIVEAPGGVYLAGDNVVRLTSGALLAIGVDHVLARECDPGLECRTLLLDRSNGQRTGDVAARAVGSAVRADVISVPSGDAGPVADTVSPDGRVALYRVDSPEAASGWVLADFTDGSWTEIPAPLDGQPLIWSDDGAVLLWASESGLFLHDRNGEGLIRIPGIGDIDAVVAVTPDFAP